MVEKIVSGGQTGVDRAALDFALENAIACGGWCPKGKPAEDGRIPEKYPLQETPSSDYAQRTEWNARDSDATVIFTEEPLLEGGSLLTAQKAAQYKKPWIHLYRAPGAERKLKAFLEFHRPKVLNIAGPRASAAPDLPRWVKKVLEEVLLEKGKVVSKST